MKGLVGWLGTPIGRFVRDVVVLAFLGASLLALLPSSMLAVAVRERAGAIAIAACVGSVLVLALSAHLVSLPLLTIGLALTAIAARATRTALPPQSATSTPTDAPALQV